MTVVSLKEYAFQPAHLHRVSRLNTCKIGATRTRERVHGIMRPTDRFLIVQTLYRTSSCRENVGSMSGGITNRSKQQPKGSPTRFNTRILQGEVIIVCNTEAASAMQIAFPRHGHLPTTPLYHQEQLHKRRHAQWIVLHAMSTCRQSKLVESGERRQEVNTANETAGATG